MGLLRGFITSTRAADISRNGVASRSYGRGAVAYVQAFGLKVIAPCSCTVINSRPPAHLVVFLLKREFEMKSITTAFLIIIFSASPVFAFCKPGETWFNWRSLKTERCEDKPQVYEALPWQRKHEICVWIKFPVETETNGNSVCKSVNAGSCRSIVRVDIRNPPASYLGSEYKCTEKLYFKSYEEHCSPSVFEEFPEQCSMIETQVSCCN